MSSNKNIVIIHYNTPYLTECLVRSVNKFVKDAKIYIFDNSDKDPFTAKFDNVIILDNTKGQIIDFDKWLKKYPDRVNTSAFKNNYGSAKHAYSVQKFMEISNDNFILLDSDILLKKDITDIIDENCAFVGNTEFWKARVGTAKRTKERAIPYLCYINVKKCKEANINYFDGERIYGLTKNGDNYDTGASFLEDIKNKNLKWKKISTQNYIVHYKAGSWVEEAKLYDNYHTIDSEQWLEIHKKLWQTNSLSTNKKVIYTCIVGGYDKLLEPSFINPEFDYICFTDNLSLSSDTWDIRPLPKDSESLSQVKKQRYVKLNPHKLLSEYDISIWVDGNVTLKGDLNEFIDETLVDGISVYIPTHPSRDCIYAEAKAVLSMRKDAKEIVNHQMEKYEKEGFPKKYGLLQSNILLRKHNEPDCIKLMEAWFNELKDNSHRDQLSFNYILWKNQDVKVKYLDKYIYKSSYFFWNGKHSKVKPIFSNRNPILSRITNVNQSKERKSVEQLKEGLRIMKERNKLKTHRVGLY